MRFSQDLKGHFLEMHFGQFSVRINTPVLIRLQRPKYTKLDLVFLQNVHAMVDLRKDFFCALIFIFCGVCRFSEIAVYFKNCGICEDREEIVMESYKLYNAIKLVVLWRL